MVIQKMFREDINRPINGVVKVDQSADNVVKDEVKEYVITRELKKHFITFFNYYCDAFDTPTADIGGWVSGFFGSGKSHFLKMLSYILENRVISGVKTVERFREKFSDDPATFMLIDRATRGKTETILFNIDIEGFSKKDKTAVLRVFAKMFYNHLGFYGENLKVAMLEQYIDQCGKTQAFREAFERRKGMSWESQRRAFAFNGKFVVPALMEVLDMSEEDAKNWFSSKETTELSIAQLVSDIKDYVSTKPKDFRLVFMADEVGQYVGTDTDMLLNLQSLVEKIGSECGGKVWVVCTGQEAIDEIIKVRADEFSRIQARFKIRMSLSSSSVDEVIQKRILEKKPEARKQLEALYDVQEPVLRNLFTFSDAILDIKGYSSAGEFATDFPFVPYQFILMQKVFAEIRKHGNSGKHLSGGERSMLSGFQEAAQKVQQKDEYALVPFYLFYDTVHTFLDSSIRNVIERCERADRDGLGVQPVDVDVLKLLYLVRYIDDIKANLDNLINLMADDIRMDKVTMREKMRASLDRLLSQNYIARSGDTYNFLTDEEQDIQREISRTNVDTSTIVDGILHRIYGDIYTTKKYRYGSYDFPFDQMVDGMRTSMATGGMTLRFLTVATDPSERSELYLMTKSAGQAVIVLADTRYYEYLERALQIRNYVKQRNISQLPKSVQDIIRDRQEEATQYELSAMEELRCAIEQGTYFVDGEKIDINSGDAVSRINQAMEYLVSHVYSDLGLITKNAGSDSDIIAILRGTQTVIPGAEPNRGAASKMEEYLEMQSLRRLPTSMADVQSRFQAVPYGWKEIDVAAVMAQLIFDQKVTIKYGGTTIQPNNPRLPDMLRKKSEVGKVSVSSRQVISTAKMKAAKDTLREYFDVMDVPDDEDGLVRFIVDRFTAQKQHYEDLDSRYTGHNYPDRQLLQEGIQLTADILAHQKDNIALIDRLLKQKEDLLDSKDDLQRVEEFFKTQVTTFDAAVKFELDIRNDRDYIEKDEQAHKSLNQIRLIVIVNKDPATTYRRIPELNTLMSTVKAAHGQMLASKRTDVLDIVRQCMGDIHTAASGDMRAKAVSDSADVFFDQQKQRIAQTESLALLDGLVPPMWQYRDAAMDRIDRLTAPVVTPPPKKGPAKPPVKKVIKSLYRQSVFPAKTLETEDDIDAYLEKIRSQMKQLLKDCDGIKLN